MKELIRTIFYNDVLIDDNSDRLCSSRAIVSLIAASAAGIMLIMNIQNQTIDMIYTSIILIVGFILSAIISGIFKKPNISTYLIAILVCLVFSLFIIGGGNQGFATLWVLLVPMFAIYLLGIKPGLIVSSYFVFLLFIVFAMPARFNLSEIYNPVFIKRFPFLYLCDYTIATYFALQRDYYQKKLKLQAYTDGLTGVFNRRMFMEQLNSINNTDSYSIVMLDLNGLKYVNDTFGHEKGDEYIRRTAAICQKEFDKHTRICRIGGDEFAFIAYGKTIDIDSKISRLHEAAATLSDKAEYKLSFSTGVVHSALHPDLSAEQIFKLADQDMYNNKINYYKDKKNNRRMYSRVDVNAPGSFYVKSGDELLGTFVGKIVDISEEGIKIEADNDKYEECLAKVMEGSAISFQALEEFVLYGENTTEIFNGQAKIMRRIENDGLITLGCKISPQSPSFSKYVDDRRISVMISKKE